MASSQVLEDIHKTLEECCLALDKICSQDEKSILKAYDKGYPLNDNEYHHLRNMIIQNWLYLPPEKGKISKYKRSKLVNLLLEHGAGFEGESDYTMSGIILEN